MPDDKNQFPLLLYPDPLTDISMLTGALFLYFERAILVTFPPVVVTYDSFELLKLVEERKPSWRDELMYWLAAWRTCHDGFTATTSAFESLEGKRINTVWLVYPANAQALEASETFLGSAGYTLDKAYEAVDLPCACGEAIRQIFLERYLEFGKDLNQLYDYCRDLFGSGRQKEFLTRCYYLRVPMLQRFGALMPDVLLSNERLLPILGAMPVERVKESPPTNSGDVVAWELFRRIVSPGMDPLRPDSIKTVNYLSQKRHDEVNRLRNRCQQIGAELVSADPKSDFLALAERALRERVAGEIKEVRELDDSALRSFVDSLLSDRDSWLGFGALIGGLVSGQSILTAGAAIASCASVGAKAYAAAAGRKQKLATSDFALIYSLPIRQPRH